MAKPSEETKRYIRSLQEKGVTDTEISEMLGLPYSTIYYQRPEVRERQRQYKRQRIEAIRDSDMEAYFQHLRSQEFRIKD
jgi:predicted transcriptional regulator